MARLLAVLRYAILAALIVAGMVIAALFVLSRTELGQERFRSFTVGWLQERIQGQLRLERITSRASLFGTVTLHGLSIEDPEGRPFLAADSATLEYDWRTLIGGEIVLERLELHAPRIVLERIAGLEDWNFQRIFSDPDDAESEVDARRLLVVQEVVIHDGGIDVRTPWEPLPGEDISPADTARIVLEPGPRGLQRVIRFEEIQARLPRMLLESPTEPGQLFEVASLSTRGFIWTEPIEVREVRGTFTLRDSILAFDAPRLDLTDSRAAAVGTLVFGGDHLRLDVRLDAEDVALADLRWLYPPLPEEGRGSFVFRMQSQEPGRTLWFAEDLVLTAPGTRLAGSFGVVTGDTLYFTQVQLRASPLDVQFLEGLLPADLPLDGLLVGTVEVEGPLSALRTRGDLRLTQRRIPVPGSANGVPARTVASREGPAGATPGGAVSSVRWSGTVDVSSRPFRIGVVRADLDRIDPQLVRGLAPAVRLEGPLSGRVEARGSATGAVNFAARLSESHAGHPPLAFEARGSFASVGGVPEFRIDLMPDSLPLSALQAWFPDARRLRGELTGTLRIAGLGREVNLVGEVGTAGGPVVVDILLDLADTRSRYRGTVELREFRFSELLPDLPAGALSVIAHVEGEGSRPEDATLRFSAEVGEGRLGDLLVRGGTADGELRAGLLLLDSLAIRTAAGSLFADGSLGVAGEERGRLAVRARAQDLAALEELVFGERRYPAGEEGSGPRLAGRAYFDGTVTGGPGDLSAGGIVTLDSIRVDAVAVGGGTVDVQYRSGPERPGWSVTGNVREVDAFGRRFTALIANVTEESGEGRFSATAGAAGGRGYQSAGGFSRVAGGTRIRVATLALRDVETTWSLVEEATVVLDAGGVDFGSLLLAREGGEGRIGARGRIPWLEEEASTARGSGAPASGGADPVADFSVELRNVRAAEILHLLQATITAEGTVSGRVDVRGSARSPRIEGDFTMSRLAIEDMVLDRLYGVARYEGRRLTGRLEARHGNRTVLEANAIVPLDLAFAAVAERRLDEPIEARIRADSLPLSLPAALIPGFSRVRGGVSGALTIAGTTREPRLEGRFDVTRGGGVWDATGVEYRDLAASLTLAGRGTVLVSASVRAGGGTANVSGTLDLEPLSNPGFDVVLRTRDFQTARRRDAELFTTGEVRLGGRYQRPLVSGRLRVERGALDLDEVWRQYQVMELDEAMLFAAVDTSVVSIRQFLPASQNPFMKNLRVDVALDLGRDVWLRSRQMNVEITGGLSVDFDRRREDLRMTGGLTALRGMYQLYGRRFEVREGEIEFHGTPGIDPNLRIVAVYLARTSDREPLEIRAVVSGTLLSPRVALSSLSEPPIGESDLVSYLIFGRPTYALGSRESQTLAAAGGSSLGRLGALGIGAVGPSVLGYAASGLETVAQSVGFADYVAITADRYGTAEAEGGFGSLLPAARFNIGWYLSEELFLSLSQRLSGGAAVQEPAVRLEWRFHPTWTIEAFSEDRAENAPALGAASVLELRKVYGLFLFREWGY